MLHEVRIAGQDECSSWAAWLERVGRPEAWDRAAEVLRAESATWDIAEFASGSLAEAAGASSARGFGQRKREPGPLEPGPSLHAGGQSGCPRGRRLARPGGHDGRRRAAKSLPPGAGALRGLLEPLLDSGPDGGRYAEYVSLLDDAWKKVESRSTFDWGLDIADLLISTPCPDPSARTRFIQALMSWALGHRQQLAHRQAVMVNMLAVGPDWVEAGDRAERSRARQHLGAAWPAPVWDCTRCCQGPESGCRNDSPNWSAAGHRGAERRPRGHARTPEPGGPC